MDWDRPRNRPGAGPGDRGVRPRATSPSTFYAPPARSAGSLIGCPAIAAAAVLFFMLSAIILGQIVNAGDTRIAGTQTAPRVTPKPTVHPSTPLPTRPPAVTPTTPPPTATALPTAVPTATVSTPYRVVRAGGDGIFLRPTPAAPEAIGTIPDGAVVTVVGPTVVESGRPWVEVRTANGVEGWVAASFLATASPDTPTPAGL